MGIPRKMVVNKNAKKFLRRHFVYCVVFSSSDKLVFILDALFRP